MTRTQPRVELRARLIGAVAIRQRRDVLLVTLDDGQRIQPTTQQAAALVAVLLADAKVHQAWLHGGVR